MTHSPMTHSIRAASLVVAVVSLSVDVAEAQLIGSTVNVSAFYPDSSTIFVDPGDRIVSAAVEYPASSFGSYNPSWQVDIGSNQLIITDTLGNARPFRDVSFNGFVLTVISGATILSASVDPSSGFAPVSLMVENGNKVLANFKGVAGDPGVASSIINLTVVPEPATIGLMAIGLAVLAIRRRAR